MFSKRQVSELREDVVAGGLELHVHGLRERAPAPGQDQGEEGRQTRESGGCDREGDGARDHERQHMRVLQAQDWHQEVVQAQEPVAARAHHRGSTLHVRKVSHFFFFVKIIGVKYEPIVIVFYEIPSARLTLHSTKLCTKFKIFRKTLVFGTRFTSETF